MHTAGLTCGSMRHFYWKCRLLYQHVQSLTCFAILPWHVIPLTPHNNWYLTFFQTLCSLALIIHCVSKTHYPELLWQWEENPWLSRARWVLCHSSSSIRAKALAQSAFLNRESMTFGLNSYWPRILSKQHYHQLSLRLSVQWFPHPWNGEQINSSPCVLG